ncbi:MAG: anaerobic sulfite reductase subunit AsrB, partial [Victivallaceae bacterium]
GEAPVSISDSGDGWMDLTIRKVGRLTDAIFSLNQGDIIYARGPYGNGFDLERSKGKNLLIVTGGTGLAPVKSIISYFNKHRDLIKGYDLILGFKTPEDILFRSEIESWSKFANIILTVDHAGPEWTGHTGVVTKHIESFNFQPGITETIVVGPPLMMKFSTLGLLQRGVPEDNIIVSFERKMSCGIGKCGHCKIDETYVCLEGPVFNYAKARKLLD